MTNRIALMRLMPVTASVLIHLGIVGAVVLGPGWAPVRMPILVVQLVEAEAPAPVEPPAPRPIVRDRRPLTPPRPIAVPRPPEPPAPVRPEPEPPRPARPEPPPAAPAPPAAEVQAPAPREPERAPAPSVTAPAWSRATEPVVAAAPEPGAGTPAAAPTAVTGPTPTAPSSPTSATAAASIPLEGVTERAIPRGGYQYRPSYPARARSLGIQGTTILHVLVSDTGRVAQVVVKQSAGHPDLDQAASDAVRRWRFEPARRGSDPVEMWVQLPFEFRLR